MRLSLCFRQDSRRRVMKSGEPQHCHLSSWGVPPELVLDLLTGERELRSDSTFESVRIESSQLS
jgi:hypothetical protein